MNKSDEDLKKEINGIIDTTVDKILSAELDLSHAVILLMMNPSILPNIITEG